VTSRRRDVVATERAAASRAREEQARRERDAAIETHRRQVVEEREAFVPVADAVSELARIDLRATAARLGQAIARDLRGHVLPDGWPAGRADGPGGGAKVTVEDENGLPDTVAVTSVELAIIARERPLRDPLHDRVAAAVRCAKAIIRDHDRLAGLLTGIDLLAVDDVPEPADPGCSSCARHHDAAGRTTWSARFRGDLCRWCYGIVNDPETNPKRRLPPLELVAAHHRGERITHTMVTAAFRKKTA